MFGEIYVCAFVLWYMIVFIAARLDRESSAFNGFGMKYKSKAVVRYLMIPQFMHHA